MMMIIDATITKAHSMALIESIKYLYRCDHLTPGANGIGNKLQTIPYYGRNGLLHHIKESCGTLHHFLEKFPLIFHIHKCATISSRTSNNNTNNNTSTTEEGIMSWVALSSEVISHLRQMNLSGEAKKESLNPEYLELCEWSMNDLKIRLKANHLPTHGRKDILIQRILTSLST